MRFNAFVIDAIVAEAPLKKCPRHECAGMASVC